MDHAHLEDLRYRLWMRSLRLLGRGLLSTAYQLRIEGVEQVPTSGGTLVVSNHVSFHDWLFVGAALPRPPRFVMHQHHFQYPALRAFFGASRVIPIAPKKQDPARLEAAFIAIDEALANGELVVIFPEGRMTENGELSEFKPGLERIVARRPVPVVPVAISGLFGSFFSRAHGEPMSGRPQRLRAPVTVRFGAPVPPERASAEPLRARIAEMLGERADVGCAQSRACGTSTGAAPSPHMSQVMASTPVVGPI